MGAGMLIATPTATHPKGLVLVTNKHVLGNWDPVHGAFEPHVWIGVLLYRRDPTKGGPREEIRIPLRGADGAISAQVLAAHPAPLVDIGVAWIDTRLVEGKQLEISMLGLNWLKPWAELPGPYCSAGAEVFALGYPAGVTSLSSGRAIAKVGHLAVSAGEELDLQTAWQQPDGTVRGQVVRGKLLLIDGLLVPGNSGGPVLEPGAGATGVDPASGLVQIRSAGSSRVLGIVSSGLGPSGLAFAYSGDYIREAVEVLVAARLSAPGAAQAPGKGETGPRAPDQGPGSSSPETP